MAETRRIVLRKRGLATYWDIMAAVVRNAELRRPREANMARLLLRPTGLARIHDVPDGARVADRLRGHLRSRRAQAKRCLAGAYVRSTPVLLPAPVALVVQQALMRGESLLWRFAIRFEGGDPRPEIVARRGPLDDEARSCLREALALPAGDTVRSGSVQLSVVAFAQRPYFPGGTSGLHASLAYQMAVLGWLDYARGDYEQALVRFGDAFWTYHLAEYRLLQAMAADRSGRAVSASRAYQDYLDQRPEGADAPWVRARLQALRAPTRDAPVGVAQALTPSRPARAP